MSARGRGGNFVVVELQCSMLTGCLDHTLSTVKTLHYKQFVIMNCLAFIVVKTCS